ncbi:MAG: hypothetical protein V4658_04340 [Bacteroidota bacterium]
MEADSIEQTNNWTYEETVDEMDGTKSKFASTGSTNTLQFAFPYDGGSTGDLVVRKTGKKLDVYLKISKGQFISSYTWDRTVDIKFDDGKTLQYAYGSSSDYSSDVIFLDNAAQLLSKLKAAKQVKIKIDFYQYSGQVLTFNTEGLNFK